MVELTKDVLDPAMTLYRSLTFKDVAPYRSAIVNCLEEDKKTADIRKIQEVVEDGQILSAYYELSPLKTNRGELLKRYILFKIGNKGKATLVYLEGYLEADQLIELLYKR